MLIIGILPDVAMGLKRRKLIELSGKKLIDIINSWKGCGNAQEIKGGQ